jgi:hypothetical protein
MKSRILFLLVALVGSAAAQYTTVTASAIQDGTGATLQTGSICFDAVDPLGNEISYKAGGGGQAVRGEVCRDVLNGAIQTTYKGVAKGTFQVADTTLTVPANICYAATVKTAAGRVVLGSQPVYPDSPSGYDCLQPSGTTFNFDAYPPTLVGFAALIPPTVTGNLSVVGTLGVSGLSSFGRVLALQGITEYGFKFNVKDYGATGDGSTNDSPAFVAARTAADTYGGCVWVPPPSVAYRVNLTHSNQFIPLCIKGVPNLSTLKPYADGTAVITVDATANSVQPITLEGLVIQGQTGFSNSIGILFKGGYTGATLVQSDHHNLQHLVIDGTTGFLFKSLIEVHGRMIWGTFRDLNLKYGYAGIKVTEDNTNEYNGAFNNNTFDKVAIQQIKGRGFAVDYTRTTGGELVAQSLVFTHGTIQGACLDTTITDCAGFYGKNTEVVDITANHLEDNGTLSADAKGAHVRLTGTAGAGYAQGFNVSGNEMTLGQYGTYVDAILAFGVIGGGNRVNVSTKPIYVATSHANSAVTILDDSKSSGAATITADANGDKHVFQPLLGAPPFYNQKSATTDESVAGITFVNLTNSSGRTLTTLSGGAPNQTVILFQAGSGTTTLTHGTSTNNMNLQPCAGNSLLTPGQSIVLQFNGTTWHIVGAPINVLCPTTIDVLGGSRFGAIAVGSLPSAASASGIMYRVTDSTAISAEGQTCVGGSSNVALAFSNGSVWKCF